MIWDGRYRVERTLGEGGMGRVVLALDLLTNKRVAIKVLLPEYRHLLDGFLREFSIQRALRHPSIPRVHELGFARHPRGEVPYFVLDYCDGVPLVNAIRSLRRLDAAWPWFLQLFRSLDYLHREGWVHRDLKPGNLLVRHDDASESSLQLIDFGVASRIGTPPEAVFIGTPEYCAPELLAGEAYDARSDLYAVGLVLYEVIMRRRPWRGSDEQCLLDDRLGTPPPPIRHPRAPAGVIELIYALLEPRPEDRPHDAAEVISAFCASFGTSAAIETPDAVGRRLHGQPIPGREALVRKSVDGDPRNQVPAPAVAIIHGAANLEGSRVIQAAGDRLSTRGSRVIRLQLPPAKKEGLAARTGGTALSAIRPALDVLLRLRGDRSGAGADWADEVPPPLGRAAAAALLTRAQDPIALVIDDLQRADDASLQVLQAVFEGASVRGLRILATVDPNETPASRFFPGFIKAPRVVIHEINPLTPQEVGSWLDRALGVGVLDVTAITELHTVGRGRPAAISEAVRALYSQQIIIREGGGYLHRGQLNKPPAEPLAPESVAEARLSCLRHPLPREVIEAYLDDEAGDLPQIVAAGLLADDGLGVLTTRDPNRRDRVYAALPAADKMRAHRLLARAIHAADVFPFQRSLVAIELMRSDKPVLAVPHLAKAASEVVGPEGVTRGLGYLDQAAALMATYAEQHPSDEAWRWNVMLWKGRVRLALRTCDLDGLEVAAGTLMELGSDAAHLPTLRYALESRMTLAYERSAWDDLVRHADARLALDGATPGPDAKALQAWALGLKTYAGGAAERALTELQRGLTLKPKPARAEILLRISRDRARILVDQQCTDLAQAAVRDYQAFAMAARDPRAEAGARLLSAEVHRQAGRPGDALEETRRLATELGGDLGPRLDGQIALALATDHLVFGWHHTAAEHAQHARALCGDLGDIRGEVLARVLLGEAMAARGDAVSIQDACDELSDALAIPLPKWHWVADHRARLAGLRLSTHRLAVEERTVIITESKNIAAEARGLGAFAPAAEALALASETALGMGEAVLGYTLAEEALNALDAAIGHGRLAHRLIAILARARTAVGSHQGAATLRLQSLERLRRVASTISDPEHRRAWLAEAGRMMPSEGEDGASAAAQSSPAFH